MESQKVAILPAQAESINLENGSIFFVGTATVILRYAGFTIMSDPNFLHQGDHVHLGYGLQSHRTTNPAIEIEDLPPLDFVVLSHMHEDHFDRVVKQKLDKKIPIVSTPHAVAELKKEGFQSTYALNPWEKLSILKGDYRLCVTAMPGRHGPGLLAAILPQVIGSLLEFQNSEGTTYFRIYISGDTLVMKDLQEIPQRYPEIDLALLHLGGTMVFGVLLTMDGRQGVEAMKMIEPQTTIPIHYNDYTVFKSPLEEFKQAVIVAGLESRVHYLSHGETYQFSVPAGRL